MMLSSLAGLLLVAFLSLLLVWPAAYAVIGLATFTLAAATLVSPSKLSRAVSTRSDAVLILVFVAYSLLWLLDVARTGVWPVGLGCDGSFLPVWPLIAALVLFSWRSYPPPIPAWWAGLLSGALLAGLVSGYEVWIEGHSRAGWDINPIPFGNIALLLATLALIGTVRSPAKLEHSKAWALRMLYASAFVAGLAASLLSGTRGSWLVFPALMLTLAMWLWRSLSRRVVFGTSLMVLLMLLAGSLSPATGVSHRLFDAVSDAENYLEGRSRGGSVATRLEMWRAGLILFYEKPLLGWGEGRLESRRNQLIEDGVVHRSAANYDQLHSDLVDTAARRGMLGLASLIALYVAPMLLFFSHRRALDPQARVLALCGLIVVIAFIGFGLTQSMLRDARGLAGYLGLVTACWCLLRSREAA